jgi:very-short-patch-repair endonuclease
LLRAAGLPAVECGVEVVPGAGPSDCVVRCDGARHGLVVEWDGDAHRVDRATFLHDREKDRLLRRAGYVTLRYTADQVRRRAPVVDDVRAEWRALRARSVQPVRRLPA